MCWTLRTTSGGNPIGITGLAVMSRRGWRTWARGVRPVVISTTSWSGRHWELDQVPAVGDLTDIVQLGTGHHVSVGEGQRRVALQRRVAAYLVGGGQTPRNVASILDSARELGIRDAQVRRSRLAGPFWMTRQAGRQTPGHLRYWE